MIAALPRPVVIAAGVVLAALVVLGLYQGVSGALSGEQDGLRRLVGRPAKASSRQSASQAPLDAEDLVSAETETLPASPQPGPATPKPAPSDLPAAEIARQDLTAAPKAGGGGRARAPDAIDDLLATPQQADRPDAPKSDTPDPAALY